MAKHKIEIDHADQDRRVFVRIGPFEVDIFVDNDDTGVNVTLYKNGLPVEGELNGDF